MRRSRWKYARVIKIIGVPVILGLIFVVGRSITTPGGGERNVSNVQLDLVALVNAVEMYQIKHTGELPSSLKQLVPGEIRELRLDPWGTPYVYVREGDTCHITSYGRDRAPGGGDDLTRRPEDRK
jgi:hypothetical protein